MHGIIFHELKKMVNELYNAEVWQQILEKANLPNKTFMAIQEYPDAELVQIVSAASAISGKPIPDLLTIFGKYIVPDLVSMYKMYLKPEWKALDMIENTEATIHRVVRIRNPGAKPPELQTERVHNNHLIISYKSARKLCAVGKGIIMGVAEAYKENLQIKEPKCMLNGDSHCELHVIARS